MGEVVNLNTARERLRPYGAQPSYSLAERLSGDTLAYKPPRTRAQIAADVLEVMCQEVGYKDANDIYSVIQALDKAPELVKDPRNQFVSPHGIYGKKWLEVSVEYIGPEKLWGHGKDRDHHARDYFRKLGEKTGLKFEDAREGCGTEATELNNYKGDIRLHADIILPGNKKIDVGVLQRYTDAPAGYVPKIRKNKNLTGI